MFRDFAPPPYRLDTTASRNHSNFMIRKPLLCLVTITIAQIRKLMYRFRYRYRYRFRFRFFYPITFNVQRSTLNRRLRPSFIQHSSLPYYLQRTTAQSVPSISIPIPIPISIFLSYNLQRSTFNLKQASSPFFHSSIPQFPVSLSS